MTENSASGLASIKDFFRGRIFPVLVLLLVFVGHATGGEVVTNLLLVILSSAAILLTGSITPLFPYIITVVFQISRINGPGVPNNSDYYATGWRLPLIVASFIILAVALVLFAVRERLYKRITGQDIIVFVPLFIFILALLFNGAFSDEWSPSSLGYGALLSLLILLPFALVYYGLMSEDRDSVISYVAYIASLTVILLVCEIALVYLTGGVIEDGGIIKENILFGWGVWNSMGAALVMMIPLVFLGVIYSPKSHICFAVSLVAMIGVVLTMSRGAWLFGAVIFALSVAVASFKSRYKIFYRILLGIGAFLAILLLVFLWDRLATIFDDNGRFALYEIGIENFISSPVFGTGFFGFELPEGQGYFKGADFIPAFAHQTFVELLSATGIVGTVAYLIYRASTVYLLIKRIDAKNILLFMAAGAMLLMSLVDNFLFNLWPTLTYSLALGAMMSFGKKRGAETTRKDNHD